MPDHCFYSSHEQPAYQEIDFTVNWNLDPKFASSRLVNNKADNQDSLNDVVCDTQRTIDSSVPLAYQFQNNGGSLDSAVGLSITGSVYHLALTPESIDPVYPTNYDGWNGLIETLKEDVDENLIHPTEEGVFHYHTVTPAIAKTQLEKSESVQAYEGDVISEIIMYFSTSDYARKMKPVGIAKDGHVIWGPYNQNSDGDFNPWEACDVDVCNGAYVNGNYGYAATLFVPYTVGCWGPGSSPNNIG